MSYCTVAELRAVDGLGDSNVFSDALLAEAAAFAKVKIDQFCKTSFGDVESAAYDSFTSVVDGNDSDTVVLKDATGGTIMYPQTITSVTIDGVADSGITYVLTPTGHVRRSEGCFDSADHGRNVVISGTAGASDTPPVDIQVAARAIAADYAKGTVNRIGDRVLSYTTSDGAYQMNAMAGAPGRPTAMAEVNQILLARRARW